MDISEIKRNLFNFEGVKTSTSFEQCNCERECASYLKKMSCYTPEELEKFLSGQLINTDQEIKILREFHANYLLKGIEKLPWGFVSLDASRPWICYWILHALYLLNEEPTHLYERVISTISHMQNKSGGFGGGPGQVSQCAPNYAAVLSLCIVQTEDALKVIDRAAMYRFFLSLKDKSGGFAMHRDGEIDTRGTYTVISIARILNILTPELCEGVADFVLRCQTYEGGFGGEPGNEAHGGYNFCAVASLLILQESQRCDVAALENWLVHRQMKLEGGFQGRTNKLVDSCYSFWQGSAMAIVEIIKNNGSDLFDMDKYFEYMNKPEPVNQDGEIELSRLSQIHKVTDASGCLSFNQKALQRYILHCAQNTEGGGLRDKPGKPRDFYHSCYALSGLSIAQNSIVCDLHPSLLTEDSAKKMDVSSQSPSIVIDDIDEESAEEELLLIPELDQGWTGIQVFGDYENVLEPTSVVFNIGFSKLKFAVDYFQKFPLCHEAMIQPLP